MNYTPFETGEGYEKPEESLEDILFEVPNDLANPSPAEAKQQDKVTTPEAAPTGSTQPTAEQPTPTPTESTDSVEQKQQKETVTFENGQTYNAEDIEYVTNMFGQKVAQVKPEAARRANAESRQQGKPPTSFYGEGDPLADVQKIATIGATGLADTVSDVVSTFTGGGVKLPKATKYEDQTMQVTREIAGFVIPELMGVGMLKRLGQVAHARVGWNVGNSALVRWLGNRGIEAGVTGIISGSKAEGAEPGNAFNLVRGLLPKQLDWVTDDLATFEGQDPDVIRQRNLNADVGLGFLIPLLPHLKKGAGAVMDVRQGLTLTPKTTQSAEVISKITPENRLTKAARAEWDGAGRTIKFDELDEAEQAKVIKNYQDAGILPQSADGDAYETIVDYMIDQENALDELGRYNLSRVMPEDGNVALKGVHDLYDFNEIGMRTVDDFGIVGAAVDQARISGNLATVNGRIRNVVSPAALKYAVNDLNSVDDIVMGLTKSLDDVDDFTASGKGWKLDRDEIWEAGDNLAIDFFDPSLDANGIRRMMGRSIGKNADGVEVLSPVAYSTLQDQLVKMGKEFNDMDIARAQAYVGTSLAGQMSDLAEAARYSRDNPVVVRAAQEKILDNMKFIMRLKGSSNYYRNLKASMVNMWDTSGAVTKQTPEQLKEGYNIAMETLNREIDTFADDLMYTFDNYPELGEAIMEMFELTDGRVFNIETVEQTFKKSLIGGTPIQAIDKDTPMLLGQAIRGNYYNSALSSVGTPVRATVGNMGGVIDEPVSYFAGALMRGKLDEVQKGFMAYNAINDVRRKAMPLMANLYKKASQNIAEVRQSTDLDYSLKMDEKLGALKKLAAAEEARGNTGGSIILNEYITLQEMAMDPAMKFSSNLMTGLDGFPRAAVANGEARFRAMEELQRQGKDINAEEVMRIANSEYDSMFDNNGLLKDKAAQYAADRISLRAETPTAQAITKMTDAFPWTRVFFPFPGTQANVISLIDETIPFPFRSFQQDVNQLAYTPMKKFQENPALVRDILERKGYDVNTMDELAQLGAISRLKNKTLGRKGVTTFLMGGFASLYFSGRVTGRGIYDKEAQLSRERNSNIPKNSIMGPDGNWYSYMDILGPGYGNWVSSVITTLENANYLGAGKVESLEKKLAFILSATLEEESGLSALAPLFSMFDGNSYEMNRWASNQVNTLGPLGGFRNEMGNLLNGGLRIVDGDFESHMLNRNKALGLITPGGDLPFITNPLDGKVPNQYNPILRLFNTYFPIKVTPASNENQLFLNDIGFSYSTMFKTKDGVDLTSPEREQLFEIMAEDKFFKREVTRLRKQAERLGYIDKLKEARNNGQNAEELQEFMTIQTQIRNAAKTAERSAFARLDSVYLSAIQKRIEERQRSKAASTLGVTEFIQRTPTR